MFNTLTRWRLHTAYPNAGIVIDGELYHSTYTNGLHKVPFDPGGATRWGVTERVARANGYTGSMRVFPETAAKHIYRKSYWDAVRADELPEAIRYAVFDAAVNSGPRQSIQWLQRSVGALADRLI